MNRPYSKLLPAKALTLEAFMSPLGAKERELLEIATKEEKALEGRTGPTIRPEAPLEVAATFIETEASVDGHSTVVFWRGRFYLWEAGVWTACEARAQGRSDVTNKLWLWLGTCMVEVKKKLVPLDPTPGMVTAVAQAMEAVVEFKGEVDTFRSSGEPGFSAMSVKNGIIDLDRMKLLPHTPDFFNTARVAAAWRPELEKEFKGSEWDRFIRCGLDDEQVELFRAWSGYLLAGDNRFQRALNLIGPPRCGKGTITRVLQRLLGSSGFTTIKTASLGDTFGMQHLVEARVAAVTDMRTSHRTNHAAVAEAFLTITGNDHQTIHRKFLSAWEGTLRARLVVSSNAVPDLRDPKGTLATRFDSIVFSRGHLGAEDIGLDAKLKAEDDLFLAWALGGLRDLLKAGRFPRTRVSEEVRLKMETRQNPIPRFVAEYFTIEPGDFMKSHDIFAVFQHWSATHSVGDFTMDRVIKLMIGELEGTGVRSDRRRVKRGGRSAGAERGLSGLKPRAEKLTEIEEALSNYLEPGVL